MRSTSGAIRVGRDAKQRSREKNGASAFSADDIKDTGTPFQKEKEINPKRKKVRYVFFAREELKVESKKRREN